MSELAEATDGTAAADGGPRHREQLPDLPNGGGVRAMRWVVAVVAVLGLLLTVGAWRVAWMLNRDNEHRLLRVQTIQAAAVVSATIVNIESPLKTALQVEAVTHGSQQELTAYLSSYVGQGKLFTSATLWQRQGSALRAVATVGSSPALPGGAAVVRSLVQRSYTSKTIVLGGIPTGSLQAIGYAVANPATSEFAVYAQRAIPANRRVPVESDSAFADVHFATYLGSAVTPSALATTDLPPSALPLTGNTARVTVPFGDTTLTLVTTPRRQLGGTLGAQLPWIFLVAGLVITVAACGATQRLMRRRLDAENDAATISELYGDLGRLYGQQRTIAETLQQALLPRSLPSMPSLDVACRHVAGAEGVDVGGDWYSVVRVDDEHFAFVVGDVSGRGVEAATIMAQLRFTLRAYLLEGHPPAAALGMCSQQLDLAVDGHFATVLVGVGHLPSGVVTLANAGHLSPLLVSRDGTRYVDVAVGPPLGVEATSYPSTTVTLARGETLVAFTDGLVERRDEDIDQGLQRLVAVAAALDGPVEALVSALLTAMTSDAPGDDVAILALRRTDA